MLCQLGERGLARAELLADSARLEAGVAPLRVRVRDRVRIRVRVGVGVGI